MSETRFRADHPNERPNFVRIDIGDLTLWFSYRTLIAFREPNRRAVLSENVWGPTTGKHINMISSPGCDRVDRVAFEEMAADLMARISIRQGPSIEEVRAEFIQILHEDIQQLHDDEPAVR